MTTITRIGREHWERRGERIEKARNFAGLTQGQLAASLTDLLGRRIGRQIIYIIEQGERDIRGDELRGISIILDQSQDWLDGIEGAVFNDAPIIHVPVNHRWFGRPIDLPAAA